MTASLVFAAPFPDLQVLRNREWLVTNGLGGYASGSLAGVPTRRYHGHFIANLPAPLGRYVLISRMEQEVRWANQLYLMGEADKETVPAAGDSGTLDRFHLDGNVVTWIYRFGDVALEKVLFMPHRQNAVCIRYRLLEGHSPIALTLRPFTPFRRHDAELAVLAPLAPAIEERAGHWVLSLPDLTLQLKASLQDKPLPFAAETVVAERRLLWREQVRGYAALVTEASVGCFQTELGPDDTLWLTAATNVAEFSDWNPETLLSAENERMQRLLNQAAYADDSMVAALTAAADQFLVLPGSRTAEKALAASEGHALRTVIAGYHWFGDWGRDTMIALEGLMLCTGRHQEARATLLTFSHYVRDGLLPNLFPEGQQEGLYHTVDATLWYFHAIHRYVATTGDRELITALLPVLRAIVSAYTEGTRFGIKVDPADGLVHAGSPQHALTWMDAHMGDWIVTPRRGKPVEIQALWFNALLLMAAWDPQSASQYNDRAKRVQAAFNSRFWNAARSCLFDVVDGDPDAQALLRPNQILSLSLEHPVLAAERWRDVVEAVGQRLLTPYGLRTLDPDDPGFQPTYYGDLRARDAAYHQGTVWPWLLGHFIDAWTRVSGEPAAGRRFLLAFSEHLAEAGIGSISEVFDAVQPHVPHGCIAQAWSVAEILRAWRKTSGATQ